MSDGYYWITYRRENDNGRLQEGKNLCGDCADELRDDYAVYDIERTGGIDSHVTACDFCECGLERAG